MDKPSYVYILASARYGTLYTGVTTDLVKRTWQHKSNLIDGFTQRYSVHTLVWYEIHGELMAAVRREKQIKHWNRAWKLDFISTHNPTWRDLYKDFTA